MLQSKSIRRRDGSPPEEAHQAALHALKRAFTDVVDTELVLRKLSKNASS